MKLRPIVFALVALFLISSCSQQEVVEPATGTWVSTIMVKRYRLVRPGEEQ